MRGQLATETAINRLAINLKRPSEKLSSSRTATRALDVLEFFGTCRKELRAVDLSRALQLTPSTINQLLKTMVDSGHLIFNARNKTYLPSPRLAQFGDWIVGQYGPDLKLSEMMRVLQRELGLVVTLSTPNDVFMQVIASAIAEGLSPERGLQISLFGSAIGNTCLTMMDAAEIERLAYRARVSPGELVDVKAELVRIREVGFAQAVSSDGAYHSIAIPLQVRGLPGPTVLGLAGPVSAIVGRVSEIVEHVRSAKARYGLVNQPASGTLESL